MRSSSSHLLLDVHSLPQSNNDVFLQQYTNANDDITIDSIIHLMIQYLLRYHHTRIALRRATRIILNLSLVSFAGLALLTVPRDACVVHKDNIERLNAACHERALRRKSTALAITSATRRKK